MSEVLFHGLNALQKTNKQKTPPPPQQQQKEQWLKIGSFKNHCWSLSLNSTNYELM